MTADLIIRIVVGLSLWTAGSIVVGLALGALLRRADDTPKDW